MKCKLLILFLVIISQISIADSIPLPELDRLYMAIRNENAIQLNYRFWVFGNCSPQIENKIGRLIPDVIERNKLEPIAHNTYESEAVFLMIEIYCHRARAGRNYYAYSVQAKFGKSNPAPPVYYAYSIGQFGFGDDQEILKWAKRAIENSVSRYTRANMSK